MMIKLAGKQGVLEQEEMQFHKNLFFLTDKKATHIMTNRTEVEMLDIAWPEEKIAEIIRASARSSFPVYEDSIDNILGLLRARDFFAGFCRASLDLRAVLIEPVFLPETVTPLQILKIFRSRQNYFGIVVNEHGSFEGVLTLHDLIEHVLGNMPDTPAEARHITVRQDGSLLVDGITPMAELLEALHLDGLDATSGSYTTVSGFIFEHVKSIPGEGFTFPAGGYRFEIVDMDGPRIDKILISKK
jgi:putative hemolysin